MIVTPLLLVEATDGLSKFSNSVAALRLRLVNANNAIDKNFENLLDRKIGVGFILK